MSDLSQDELTVLSLANAGESMIPIGRWKEPTLALERKGFLKANDSSNFVITDAGRAEHVRQEDEPYRKILESGTKVQNARTQAQQSVEQAALHLSYAARASVLVTGDSVEDAIASWLDIVKERALELAKGG